MVAEKNESIERCLIYQVLQLRFSWKIKTMVISSAQPTNTEGFRVQKPRQTVKMLFNVHGVLRQSSTGHRI